MISTKRFWLLALLLCCSVACGDTPDGDDDDDTAAADAASTGRPDAEVASAPDAAPALPDAQPTPDGSAGACLNEADQAIPVETIDATADTCGNQCAFDATPNCVRDCMTDAIAISEGCAACYDSMVRCMISNCALQCIDDTSAGCAECRLAHCSADFTACSGLEG